MNTDCPTIAGVILAAGYSSRMGEFKPLLPLGSVTAIERSVGALRDGGVEDVRVVVGWRAGDLAPVLDRLKVRTVVNPHFEAGMYSSMMAGFRTLEPATQAFVLLPVDNSLVKPRTVCDLVRRYLETGPAVAYPAFLGRRGHPPVVSTFCLRGAPSSDLPGGLRSLLARYEDAALDVDVADQGTVMDMDTPSDYEDLKRYCAREGTPTEGECEALLRMRRLPSRVADHSRAVARVATRLATLLLAQGVALDGDLVLAAALLHDVARGLPDHATEGARIVEELGYPRVAACIARHMELAPGQVGELAETQLVYLADKLVKEDRVVSLPERLTLMASRHAGHQGALNAGTARLRDAEAILQRVAGLLRLPAEGIVADLRAYE